MKQCSKCKEVKSTDDFPITNKKTGRLSSWCRECGREANRRSYQRNRGTRKRDEPGYWRERHLLAKYGLTIVEWDAMWDSQNGQCAVCSKALVKEKYGVATDHCHTSGKVRGLLCESCNKAIGFAYDSPEVLRGLADYLEASRAAK